MSIAEREIFQKNYIFALISGNRSPYTCVAVFLLPLAVVRSLASVHDVVLLTNYNYF